MLLLIVALVVLAVALVVVAVVYVVVVVVNAVATPKVLIFSLLVKLNIIIIVSNNEITDE